MAANTTTEDIRDVHLAYVEIAVQVIILAIALLGNTFILLALLRQRRIRPLSRVYLLMAHLSVADLLVALFNILPQLAWDITFRFHGGNALCKVVKYLQVFVLYLSTYILVVMSVDRYLSVKNVNVFQPIRMVNAMICGAWILAALLALPQAFIFSLREANPGVYDCWGQFVEPWGVRSYVTWFVLSVFVVPIVVIILCCALMCGTVWRYDQKSIRILKPDAKVKVRNHGSMTRAKMKASKLTLTVVICFFVCWLPFCATQLCVAFNPPIGGQDVSPLQTILLLLASLNSCTNPWIYLVFSGSLVNQLRSLFGLTIAATSDNDSVGDDDPPRNTKRTLPLQTLPRVICTDQTECL